MISFRHILPAFLALLLIGTTASAQVEFVENKGQWHSSFNFRGEIKTGQFFLEPSGFSVLMHDADELGRFAKFAHGIEEVKESVLHSVYFKVRFLGALAGKPVPEKPSGSYNNYYTGNDPSKWVSACKLYQAVTYKNVYPNIDVRYYSDGDHLKYDFIVHPGGNPSLIALQYDGVKELQLKNQELIVKTSAGDIRELPPYSYQVGNANNGKEEIECKYVVRNNVVTFQLKKYDRNRVLVIDPFLIFASFTGSRVDNWGYTATPGPDGSFYAGGIAFQGNVPNGFPTSPGAFQTTFGGGVPDGGLSGYDIAIFKFSANGTARLYATYLGGSSNEQPHSMICDAQGNLVVAGRSSSTNYPTTARFGAQGGADIIITKFNAAGTALIGSVKIGGVSDDGINIRTKYLAPAGTQTIRRNYGDDARSEVIFDNSGNITLASCTRSLDFPVVGPLLNNGGNAGSQDGVVLQFNSTLSQYLFGSYFGGSGDDACFVASVNPLSGNLFIAGGTTSSNLRGVTAGVVGNSYRGGQTDGFIFEIAMPARTLVRTSYLGTNQADIVYGLKFDKRGFPYVMGTSEGSWPVVNAAYQNANSAQFVAKLQPNFSSFVYSTVLGSGSAQPNISPIGFLVDRCENVYISGWGGGINASQNYSQGNTSGMPRNNALTGIPGPDGRDFYFLVLEKNANSLLFGSHFGQNGGLGDHVDGGTSRFDENGIIYQAICGNCGGDVSFPTTPGAWSSSNGSGNQCNEIALKIEMSFSGVSGNVKASIDGVANDTSGCIPFRVDFRDTLNKGKKYYWDFGNGLKDTTFAPEFSTFTTYTQVGIYTVMVIAEDSFTCNIRDTAFIKIRAGINVANLGFRVVKAPPCTSLTYNFINESTPTFGSFGPQSFTWDFGDGSPPVTGFNASHTFPAVGDYTVTLTLTDTVFCNAPESISRPIRVNPLVDATFITSPIGCAPYLAQFTNTSGTSDVTWEFSDGTTTNVENPTKSYPLPGTYTVRLIARDPNTCNLVDTSDYFTITVYPKPTAAFSWSPEPPERNTPTQFTNLSTGADHYLWDFGDGETSTEVNPRHQFNATGGYTVTLVAFNPQNCSDTFSRTVTALIDPLLDVPNAFTPGKFGINSIVTVAGFGIARMDWKIYNRWGQLVFQTSNRKQGWDGTFKGKLQPMDVYVYTLDVEFSDGKKLRKTGDITLLR